MVAHRTEVHQTVAHLHTIIDVRTQNAHVPMGGASKGGASNGGASGGGASGMGAVGISAVAL